MIVQKPADLNPAMKSALKNHIMRKRQQLKQELEQDAIEKRLKREQEAKRKQDAMTLDQLKEQLGQLEKTLDNLKNEKHSLFAQLKQNMRVLNMDDARRKQKEGELNAARQQLHDEQNRQQLHQQQQSQPSNQQQPQQQQQTVTNGSLQHSSVSNQENHIPTTRDKSHDIPLQQPHLYHPQTNHHEQDTPPTNSHQLSQPSSHIQRPNSLFNSTAFSHLMNAHNFPRQSPYLHLPPNRSSNPYGPMSPYPPLGHHAPPSLISGHGIPTSLSHVPQQNSMIRPSPPPMSNNPGQLGAGPTKLSMSLPITSSGPPTPMDFNPNLASQTAHQMQQQAITNQAAAAAAALGIPYNPSYFSSNSPIGPPISSHQPLEHHAALSAAAAAAVHNHLSGNGGNPSNMGNNSNVNGAINSSHGNPLPPMKRPISATSLANDTLSPNKKVHTQPPPPPPQNLQHQIPASLSNPYLAYPGLPPGLNSSSGPSLPTNLFGPNLIRTPPPPNISSLFNSAAFSHLLNAHNFPRQSPYLHLPPNRSSNPYGPMSPYPPLGHHAPPSLISGHGIPTSLSHVPQQNSMIRPSPPPMSNNPGQLGAGPTKLSMSLPITSSGPPTPMDFNPNLASQTAHQMQQQAITNQAAAAAAALGIPYNPSYFSSNSPIGPPLTSQQALEHHALNAAAAAAAAAAASTHNILAGNSNNPNSSNNNNIKSRVAPYQ